MQTDAIAWRKDVSADFAVWMEPAGCIMRRQGVTVGQMNGPLARKAVIRGIRAVRLQTRTAGQGIMVQDITEEGTIDNKYRKGRQSQGGGRFFRHRHWHCNKWT